MSCLRDKVRSQGKARSRSVAASYQKEQAEVIWPPGPDASWVPPVRYVPGTPN